jgi:hypothetical protein
MQGTLQASAILTNAEVNPHNGPKLPGICPEQSESCDRMVAWTGG